MTRVVLLGDSIFDNAAYVGPGGTAVIGHLRQRAAPHGWSAELHAVDGATAEDVPAQVAAAGPDRNAVCVLSAGGNNALAHRGLLDDDRPGVSYQAVFTALHSYREAFRAMYTCGLDAVLASGAQLIACTIYNGAFPEAELAGRAATGVALFNDVIVQEALQRDLAVLDLRNVCSDPGCFANAIEPSDEGGARIAAAVNPWSGVPRPTGRCIASFQRARRRE